MDRAARRRVGLACGTALVLAGLGCELVGGIHTISLAPPDEAPDDGGLIRAPDGALLFPDGAVAPPGTGNADGGDATVVPPGPYNALTEPANWSTFDLGTVSTGILGFKGGVFDGRYVYFVPNRDPVTGRQSGVDRPARSVVVQYDTTASFDSKAAWQTFDTTQIPLFTKAGGFRGGVFDGRYLYLVPNWNGTSPQGVIARYDTKAPFAAAASWTSFDLGAANGSAKGFHGGVFDGRYVYLVPFQNNTNTGQDGVVARYDTQAPFATASSWTTFDMATVAGTAKGFAGGVFDGRYVYFVPRCGSTATPTSGTSTAMRYDTQAPFATASSWTSFDTTKVNANTRGFLGGAFDGQYVYYMPHFLTAPDGFTGTFGRYDTRLPFNDAASWAPFDTATVTPTARAFGGGAFDGRYIYFVPLNDGSPSGMVARYDTTAPFSTVGSWSTFDTGSLSGSPRWFGGAAFDGQYLYFVPFGTSVAVRFTARTTRAMPQLPAFFGSFL